MLTQSLLVMLVESVGPGKRPRDRRAGLGDQAGWLWVRHVPWRSGSPFVDAPRTYPDALEDRRKPLCGNHFISAEVLSKSTVCTVACYFNHCAEFSLRESFSSAFSLAFAQQWVIINCMNLDHILYSLWEDTSVLEYEMFENFASLALWKKIFLPWKHYPRCWWVWDFFLW